MDERAQSSDDDSVAESDIYTCTSRRYEDESIPSIQLTTEKTREATVPSFPISVDHDDDDTFAEIYASFQNFVARDGDDTCTEIYTAGGTLPPNDEDTVAYAFRKSAQQEQRRVFSEFDLDEVLEISSRTASTTPPSPKNTHIKVRKKTSLFSPIVSTFAAFGRSRGASSLDTPTDDASSKGSCLSGPSPLCTPPDKQTDEKANNDEGFGHQSKNPPHLIFLGNFAVPASASEALSFKKKKTESTEDSSGDESNCGLPRLAIVLLMVIIIAISVIIARVLTTTNGSTVSLNNSALQYQGFQPSPRNSPMLVDTASSRGHPPPRPVAIPPSDSPAFQYQGSQPPPTNNPLLVNPVPSHDLPSSRSILIPPSTSPSTPSLQTKLPSSDLLSASASSSLPVTSPKSGPQPGSFSTNTPQQSLTSAPNTSRTTSDPTRLVQTLLPTSAPSAESITELSNTTAFTSPDPTLRPTPQPTSSFTFQPTIGPTYSEPIKAETDMTTNSSLMLHAAILEAAPFSKNDLENRDSPQYRAMNWLQSDPSNIGLPMERLIIRWALATLAESTRLTNWKNNYLWLKSDNECSWNGIICDDHGNINSISLHDNGLFGKLPKELSVLGHDLVVLDVGKNSLFGNFPRRLGNNLVNLKTLNAEHNDFTGAIPRTIGKLANLRALLLMKNKFSGNVPATLRRLQNIEILDIHDNRLSGEIPNEVCSISSLRDLIIDCQKVKSDCWTVCFTGA